ncbi:MAG: glycerophosphoryl diester phosphodiesterase membrane domain-containing protein [Actinomycetota bacterium]
MGDAVATAARMVATNWRTWLRTAVVLQALVALLAGPAIVVLLRGALRAAGVAALTEASVGQVVRHPLSLLLLLLLAGVATTAVLLQHAAFVLLGRDLAEARTPRIRDLAGEGLATARRLAGPQAGLLALYAFVLAPLGGFGLGASLTRGIELPPFIAGELQKTPLGTAAWLVGFAVVLVLNLRLVLVPTLLLTTEMRPAAAFAASWRLTRRRSIRLALLALALWLGGIVVATGMVTMAVAATRLSDSVWPAASVAVAGIALTVTQVFVVVGAGLVAAFVSVVLLAVSRPNWPAATDPVLAATAPGPRVLTACLVLVLAGSAVNAGALLSAGTGRTTAIVAHRGATYGAVENTIESLEAAAALGAEHVELDVLQAGDGGLVVVHDTNLRRIAGVNRNVFEMTTTELTGTAISQGVHAGTIPTFDAFAARAAELGVSLLVELKEHGRERGDLVGDVVAVIKEHDLVGTALVQAFDRETVSEIEDRFPEVTTGWVVAFSRGRLDPGAADFVTLEQTSWSPNVQGQAHTAGVRVFLWTVTDPVRMRTFMREGVDGIITGHPSRALEQRAVVEAETGLAGRLEDALRALVDW